MRFFSSPRAPHLHALLAPPPRRSPRALLSPQPRAPRALLVSLALLIALAAPACASGVDVGDTSTTAGAGGTGGNTGGSAGTAGTGGDPTTTSTSDTSTPTTTPTTITPVESACPPGAYAVGLDFENKLSCQPFTPAARDAINDGCSVYLGWRDACTGCDLPPTKWGYASATACENGAGANDTCTSPILDGTAIQLFGLDFDGNVNSDDKVHLGLHCPAADSTPQDGPCPVGSFATTLGDTTKCIPAAAPVLDHVRTRCGIYFGWRDACDDCTSAPDRWGMTSPTGCTVGLGGTNTCGTYALGDQEVGLFGLSLGGDVDGNDKLYMALHCDPAVPGGATTKGACPPGQLITAVDAEGLFTCESPAQLVAKYFDDHCTLYFGWRDSCNGCTDPPAKWGRMR
ncbi:MAG: hypothetical protein R3B70_16910, partial [Polyangiaceae bacterium]